MGGQAGCYSWDQEASNGRIVLPTATFLLTPNLKIPDELDSYTAIHSALSLWCVCVGSKGNRQVVAEEKSALQCRFLPQPLRCIPIPEG